MLTSELRGGRPRKVTNDRPMTPPWVKTRTVRSACSSAIRSRARSARARNSLCDSALGVTRTSWSWPARIRFQRAEGLAHRRSPRASSPGRHSCSSWSTSGSTPSPAQTIGCGLLRPREAAGDDDVGAERLADEPVAEQPGLLDPAFGQPVLVDQRVACRRRLAWLTCASPWRMSQRVVTSTEGRGGVGQTESGAAAVEGRGGRPGVGDGVGAGQLRGAASSVTSTVVGVAVADVA